MTIFWPLDVLIVVREHPLPMDQVKAAARRGVWLPTNAHWVEHGAINDRLSFRLSRADGLGGQWLFVIGKN